MGTGSKILDQLANELNKKEITIKQKIKLDEDVYNALEYLNNRGINTNSIIKEALSTWRKKGVIKIAAEIEKEIVKAEKIGNVGQI